MRKSEAGEVGKEKGQGAEGGKSKVWIIVLIVLVVAALGAAGFYFFYYRKHHPKIEIPAGPGYNEALGYSTNALERFNGIFQRSHNSIGYRSHRHLYRYV